MALAPLPPNSTDRVFVRYFTGWNEHTLICRTNALEFAQSDVLQDIKAFLDSVRPVLSSAWAIREVSTQLAGSLVTFPIDPGVLAGFTGGSAGTQALEDAPVQWNFIGRGTSTGRKTRVGLYGLNTTRPASFRLSGAGLPLWATEAINSLTASSVRSFVTIGGDRATWYDYVNAQFNSYWESEQRSG